MRLQIAQGSGAQFARTGAQFTLAFVLTAALLVPIGFEGLDDPCDKGMEVAQQCGLTCADGGSMAAYKLCAPFEISDEFWKLLGVAVLVGVCIPLVRVPIANTDRSKSNHRGAGSPTLSARLGDEYSIHSSSPRRLRPAVPTGVAGSSPDPSPRRRQRVVENGGPPHRVVRVSTEVTQPGGGTVGAAQAGPSVGSMATALPPALEMQDGENMDWDQPALVEHEV